ncbi:Glycosyl transferase, family 2 [Prochlorococcus marinus str. MIT 9515]|uniref:Glycosyl transferase, family 2 n=2 Tax=Prochlorococcus marinus TaxID=1219 RepID=A2BW78_PROM5|nr:Glycosyl transferase, family 2 [Prochlorococcus marinus str. MIT 9515]
MVMNVSIVIPTYNRKPILEKCLKALEKQILNATISNYEIVVIDDGSTDGTPSWIRNNSKILPHVVLFEQKHGGPALGRNLGVMKSKYEVIIFIDSDLIVLEDFLVCHVNKLSFSWERDNKKCFTYGSVINTSNFKNPENEKFKLTDVSFAYFATGNVAISKDLLLNVGLFDSSFSLYGWEDLELGERLKKIGTKLVKCPEAVGFHWHPPFDCGQIESLISQEKERARMALVFYKKHSNLRVRFMIQLTPIHTLLWEIMCLGGLITIKRLFPLLKFLVDSGKNRIALEIVRIPLNLIYVKELGRLI